MQLVLFHDDDLLVIGSKRLMGLGIDVVESPHDNVLKSSSDDTLSPDQATQAVLAKRDGPMEHRVAQVGQVLVALGGIQAVTVKAMLPGSDDGVPEALVARGRPMFMAPGEVCQALAEGLQMALGCAMQRGMESESFGRTGRLVF